MRFSILYSGFVGFVMIGQWMMAYLAGQIIELETEPIRIGFHIGAELITAACLIISAGALHKDKAWGRELALVSTGMLLYTTLVSPGYFAQQGNWIWPGIFGLIMIGGVVSAYQIAQN